MSKLLLYCTKAMPYLVDERKMRYHNFVLGDSSVLKSNEKDLVLNGKIVAECDFDVEEIFSEKLDVEVGYEPLFYTETIDDIAKGSCLTQFEIENYLGCKKGGEVVGYAIHINNLHIFDEPKELGQYYSQVQVDWIEETELHRLKNGITTAPQNMCYAYKYSYSNGKLEKYILISIKPQWLCKIINGEKTIEVRKKVLKEMLGND